MNSLQKRFDSITKQLENSVAQYERALKSGNTGSIQRFSDKLDRAKDAAAQFHDELSKYGDDFQTITANVDKAQLALNRLLERQAKMDATGVKRTSKAYQGLMYDIKQAENTLSEHKAQLNEALG